MAHLVQPSSRELVITFVKGEGVLLKFWGLPVSSLGIVKKIEDQFKKAGYDLEQTSGFLNSNQTPVGFKGAVFSKFKLQWCRARVVQVRGYNELLVQLLDYGNEEIVSSADLRNLDDSYFRVSPQALECILADVIPSYPNEWSSEAIHFCEQHLVCQTVSCCIVSQHLRRLNNDNVEKVPIVRIAKKGEKDPFVQRLINSGLAYIKPEIQHHQVQQPPVPIQQISSYKMNMLDPNTTHLVRISFIESAQKFFVQLAAAELELKKLMDKIKIYTSTETMSLLHAPLVNTPCLAQFSSKQVFYRAVITAVVDGRCSVLFVDYGCSELKDFQELRALPNRFLGLQTQAICCSLKPGDTSSEKCFKPSKPGELILLNLHVLGFNSEAFLVRLTLYEAELPVRLRPTAVTPPPPIFYRRQTLDVGNYYDVTVSFISDVSEFYFQLTHFKDHLDGLSSHLNGDFFETVTLPECLPNMPVCVKYSEDDVWYRAQVIKVNHERDIEVFFVDFGNYDNAYLKNIRKLKAEFMTLPVQAFKCCLFETESPTESGLRDDMFAFFEELTASQVLKAQVRAVTDGQCYVVTLQEPNATISVNEKIQMKFSAINSVPISDIELLCITVFTSPDLFFAQFVKLSNDKLNLMQEQINEFYLTRRNTSFMPAVGSYVCAKYALDGQFYRAVVESVCGMQCEVFFVDYGNREVVAVQELHPMQKEFMANPQFGIECGLETFPPATPVEKLKILMEGACIQARMVKEQNKKWVIALTEDYPKNVAILEFLRQHEMLVPRSIHGAGLRGFQGSAREDSYPAAVSGRNGYQNTPGFDPMPSQRNENLTKKDSQPSNQSFDVMSIPLSAYRNVYVSYVVSPSEFYVQIEEESSKLDVLMKQIEASYRNNNNEELNFVKLTIDAPCCAMFEDDEVWYRGQIREVEANKCSVYFIDYGNTDSVFTAKVKVLQRQFFGLPPQALCCKSHNVSPKNGTWSDADIETFSDMTLEKSFVAQFVESDGNGVYSVNLVSASKLEEDVLNKEFASLVQSRSEPKPPSRQPVVQEVRAIPAEVKPKRDPHIAASSNVRLQPPRVQVGSKEDVMVPYGLNPGEVFCQLKTTERDFKAMMLNLQSYYTKVSATEAMIDNPHQNMVCVAQFLQDLAWYRAEIRSVDRNSLTICYIDYGNCETVDKQKVRSITQEFASLPVQGIKCRLKGIRPPGQSWTINQNISKYFEGESQCHFIEKDGDCFIVDILCNNRSVAQQLVSDGLAASNAPSASNAPAASNAPIAKQSLSSKAETKQSIPKKEIGFVQGQLLSVAVSFVESPYKFWCQLLDEAESLEQLMADIEVQYLESENLPIGASDLAVGSYCMAKYSADEAWYRAQIKSCASAGEYEVFFIDYGNSEVTSSNQLASIHQEFLTLPPQCFECRLHRAPSTCDAKITEDFQAVVNQVEELTAKVEIVANNVCVLTLLYEKGTDEVNLSDDLFGEATPVEVAKFPNPDIPLGPKEGYVTEIISPREFFIQLAGIEDDLADLSTRLSNECEAGATSGNEEVLQNPSVGCACSAKYSEDNNWYRAEVIALQETTVDVLFVDYGNTNNVSKDSLQILNQSFLDVPPYAIKCKLNGIVPPGDQWAENAITSFSDMVLESALGITFISKDIPATVNIMKDDKDVAQSLVDLELASVETCPEEAYVDDHLTTVEDNLHSLPSDFSYPKRKLLSMRLPVKICYIDSFSKFYCMPLELSTELDTVMKTLEILYSPSAEDETASATLLSPLEDPAISMACVAKYSEDENWYRAIITEIDGENIYVTFVDYGNSEVTTLENLRPMTPELIKIPPIAVECSLYSIQAIEGKEHQITDKLENLYVDEVELEMEIVSVDLVYSVRLHHDGDLSDFFTKEGLAVVVMPPSESMDKVLIENINDNVKENLKTAFVELPEELKSFIPLRTVSLDEPLLVSIKFSKIENELLVMYGVPSDLEDSLEKFQDNLQVAYNQVEGRVESIACLDFCVAKYAEDEMWYRAQVVSSESNEIRVKFIDYGNTEIVSIDSLGNLLPEFMSEPQFSIKFCLSGCKVRQDKSEELQGKIDESFYNDPILVKMCKYEHSLPAICCVDLVCGEVNIVELLLKEKLLLHQFTVNPQLNHKFEGTIESILDSVFYILPIQFREDRDKLRSRLLEVCDASSSDGEIDPGRLYAAKLEECWSRVAISVINNSTDSALVKCLDYGQDVEIELSNLVLLPEELCHCPLLLQPCLIANVEKTPDVIIRQDIREMKDKIFQCEILNSPPLQFPLEIKISEKDLNLDTVLETHTADEDARCKIGSEASASVDILKSIEEDLSAYSDLVSDIEHNPTDKTAEIISDVDISKTDGEKVLSSAKSTCDVKERAHEHSDISEDELEEPILKESAYVCGEKKDEEEKNEDSEFEEFQSDEGDIFTDVLNETDSFVEEMKNLAQDMKAAAGDFASEKTMNLNETLGKVDGKQSFINDVIPEEELLANPDLVENELLPLSDQLLEAPHKDSVVENGLENGVESDSVDQNIFGFPDPDSAGFEMPNVDDSALSQTEDEIKELDPESQFPESEAADRLLETEDEDGSSRVAQSEACDDKLEEEESYLPESDELAGLAGSDKVESLDTVKITESDKVESLDNFDTTESDKVESFDNAETTESDKMENFDNVERTESDKVESLDNVETTESDKVESLENIETTESDNVEITESDKVESFHNFQTTESDKVESLDNVETESDKVESFDNVETTESDKVENLENIESAESDKLENPSSIQSTENSNNIDIHEVKSDDMDSAEDLVESSKLERNPRGVAVEDNEWDERPECDIKPEQVIVDTAMEDDTPKQKTAIHEGLLGDLIGTSWHKTYGILKASVTDVSILDGIIVVKIEPSPEELGSVLFGTYKDVYNKKGRDLPNPSVSNLCAVNFNDDWYRAKITDVRENTLIVSLIDTGTTETVQRSTIKDLDVAHRAPLISAQCSLANVYCLPEKSSTTKDFMNSLLKDDTKQTFVELVEATNPTNIKINLLLDGENIMYKLLPKKSIIQKISLASIATGQHSAKLSHFSNLSEMYVHLISQLDDLQKLRVSMQSAYPSDVEVPMVESGVYAMKHNGAWVRGEAVPSEQGLVLRLVDDGETTLVVGGELYTLLPEHCRHPPYAVECKISLEMLHGDVDLEKVKGVLEASEFVVNIEASSSGIVACIMDDNVIKKISEESHLKGT